MIDARNENETSSTKRLNVKFNLKKQRKRTTLDNEWDKGFACPFSICLQKCLIGGGRPGLNLPEGRPNALCTMVCDTSFEHHDPPVLVASPTPSLQKY